MRKGAHQSTESREKISQAVKKQRFEGRVKWVSINAARTEHDLLVKSLVNCLPAIGAKVLWADLPGQKRPDIVYYLNGEVVFEDIKLNGKHEIDGRVSIN